MELPRSRNSDEAFYIRVRDVGAHVSPQETEQSVSAQTHPHGVLGASRLLCSAGTSLGLVCVFCCFKRLDI